MEEKLTLSVVMPVYNACEFLSESINSVLGQTYTDFELIVVDDCSKDNSYDILCEYMSRDSRVKVFKNEENKGVSYTRNFAVSKAKGEYIALIDSDDIWDKNKLKKQLEHLKKHSDAAFCYTGSAFIYSDSKKSDFVFRVPKKVDYKTLLKQNVASCSSVVIKRDWLLKYPMAHDKMHEDFAVWLSVLKECSFAYGIDEPLLMYRVADNSKSSNKLKAALMNYRTYKYVGLNYFQRLYYMGWYIIAGLKKHSSI